jgi:dTDP-4-dehydrorhamnose reductase
MLGSTVTRLLNSSKHDVFEINRKGVSVGSRGVVRSFDVASQDTSSLFQGQPRYDFVVNCIGLIKQQIKSNFLSDNKAALQINSLFPLELVEQAEIYGARVIQIATDCVFSGKFGDYKELDERDPTDVYGYSKALGETNSPNLLTLRVSIIGRELNSMASLMEWVINQPSGARIDGYSNHIWNGISTYHFAKIVESFLDGAPFNPGLFHVVPLDKITKLKLVELIAKTFGRSDIEITPKNHEVAIDRTLSTIFPDQNQDTWDQCGYTNIPTIKQIVHDYAKWLELS